MDIVANFIVQFPLRTEKYQEDILNKRFEIGRKIYNSLVTVSQKRYKEMIKTRKYRNLMSMLTGNKKSDKPILKQIDQIRKEYGLTEYSLHADVKEMQKHFKKPLILSLLRRLLLLSGNLMISCFMKMVNEFIIRNMEI